MLKSLPQMNSAFEFPQLCDPIIDIQLLIAMHEMDLAVLSKFQEIIRGYASSKSFSFGIPPQQISPEMPKLNRKKAKICKEKSKQERREGCLNT